MWNPKTGEPTKLLFTRYDHNVCSLSLSPDGLMLARGSHNKDIKIWEVTTGTELMTLLGKDQYDHHWSVCVAFCPDGIHLASGTDIGKIKLWEVLPSGEEKILHDGHWRRDADDSTETRGYFIEDDGGFQKPMDYWIGAMTFTPDGKTLITGSRDKTIKFFEMPKLIENGHLFLAQPPLYRISKGGKTEYAQDDAQKDELVRTQFGGKADITRFKGLGVMQSVHLRETTMDPTRRVLLKVDVPTAASAGDRREEMRVRTLVEDLMGRKPEKRYAFITENAKFARDLDV